MTKISGIIPTSARIEAIDIKKERPVRAGSPSIGQPEVTPAARAPAFPTDTAGGLSEEDLERPFKLTGPRSDNKDVELLSDRFFMKGRFDKTDVEDLESDLGDVEMGPKPRLSILA